MGSAASLRIACLNCCDSVLCVRLPIMLAIHAALYVCIRSLYVASHVVGQYPCCGATFVGFASYAQHLFACRLLQGVADEGNPAGASGKLLRRPAQGALAVLAEWESWKGWQTVWGHRCFIGGYEEPVWSLDRCRQTNTNSGLNGYMHIMYIYIYICNYIYIYIIVCMMCIHIYIYIYTYCVYMYTYKYKYIYIYTHMYTRSWTP